MVKTITVDELHELIENGTAPLIIDVRESAENQAESIEGTCLIPVDEISVAKLPVTKGMIVLHCKSGKRSALACEKLLAENPNLEVYSLQGGITAWRDAGYRTIT